MATAPTPTSAPADPLLETQVFWMRHKNTIIIAVVALLVAIAAYGAYRFITARAETAAATMLGNAKTPAEILEMLLDDPSEEVAGAAASRLNLEE